MCDRRQRRDMDSRMCPQVDATPAFPNAVAHCRTGIRISQIDRHERRASASRLNAVIQLFEST